MSLVQRREGRYRNNSFSDDVLVCYKGIQLFRERLSEKVHATIPRGIVGGFEFSVLHTSLSAMKCFILLDSYKNQEESKSCSFTVTLKCTKKILCGNTL